MSNQANVKKQRAPQHKSNDNSTHNSRSSNRASSLVRESPAYYSKVSALEKNIQKRLTETQSYIKKNLRKENEVKFKQESGYWPEAKK